MKATIKTLGIVTIGLFAASACNKEPLGPGTMTVKMKDDPADLDSINVEVIGVDVHYSGSDIGWISLPTNAGVYNLLDLQDSVTAVLSSNAGLPAGDVNQMRLILGNENYVVEDSIASDLLLSSQDKTGLKFNLNATINTGDTVVVLIDFDAEESIIQQGDGSYRLKPVIDVEEIIYY